jgi:hypothetical protein
MRERDGETNNEELGIRDMLKEKEMRGSVFENINNIREM